MFNSPSPQPGTAVLAVRGLVRTAKRKASSMGKLTPGGKSVRVLRIILVGQTTTTTMMMAIITTTPQLQAFMVRDPHCKRLLPLTQYVSLRQIDPIGAE